VQPYPRSGKLTSRPFGAVTSHHLLSGFLFGSIGEWKTNIVITVPLAPMALGVFHKTKPRLVVLEVCRPGKSSQDLCRRIRVNSESVPLLVLSDGGGVADVGLLLTLGADGYITKPFSPDESMARVRAAMRHLIS
jgi:DNA-binding response OmpR family regulator